MTVITRFAPSPTGFLHIGGARTALFNYLFAKRHGGKFLLRVEDTDKARSTEAATEAILHGLSWLGLDWDDDVYYQSAFEKEHAALAHQLVEKRHAYYCYLSKDELQTMRDEAQERNERLKIRSPWRDKPSEPPADIEPVIRFKAPNTGSITLFDHIQGEITVQSDEIDDFIILRSDNTPTYMLSVVYDDYTMGITHVIRGDDHLNNAFKQQLIYEAMGWDVPAFAHIPLIHGPDGAKLSKRHGALGVEAYREMGYLPEGLRNYLLRLGWSHGDDEIISDQQAIEWFDLEHIGRAPARFDFAKLASVNGHYLKAMDDETLLQELRKREAELTEIADKTPEEIDFVRIGKAMPLLKERSNTLKELAEQSAFIIARVSPYTEKAAKQLEQGADLMPEIVRTLEAVDPWKADTIKQALYDFSVLKGTKLGKIMPPVRAGVCGTMEAPDLVTILEVLGKDEVLGRLRKL